MKSWREKVFFLFGEDSGGKESSAFDKVIGVTIAFSIVVAVLATEPVIRADHMELLVKLDIGVAIIFSIEYLLRLWVAPLREGAKKGLNGAIEHAKTPMALLDLAAIAPTILGFISPELYLLRVFRLIRLGRVGRSRQFKKSIQYFNHAISSKKQELQIASVYSAIVVATSSVLMFLAEGKVQEEQFGSIPRCLWWSVITVTTVGYGDSYPVTALGKVIAGITAICGIAVIAIPIGIISAGFTESLGSEGSTKQIE